MTAGRELDALVAQKVMDEKPYYVVLFAGSTFGSFPTVEEAEVIARKVQGDYRACIIPYYYEPKHSTSIADAWPVVLKLCESGVEVQIHIDLCGTNVAVIDGETVLADVTEKEAPLAICLAGLKAKGVEI